MPRIKASVIEDVRRLSIAEVISPHVELIRKGRNVMGLCPFHSEKTPSFHVNEDKNFFKCFGCGEAGDNITFIMKYKNLDYPGAVTWLCENYGIALEYDDTDAPTKPLKELKAIHEYIAEKAQGLLFSPAGTVALRYIKERGFSEEIIKTFELGYIPSTFDTSEVEKLFSPAVIKDSGLLYNTRAGYKCFFEDRVLFPIRTATGACVGFSGRTMNKNEKAKYKNSPETPIFSKRRELYNIHRAKDVMREHKSCYIAEGYFDVMRLHQAGYQETVAIMGTAFTSQQVTQLIHHAEEYNLVLDGDSAGLKAMAESAQVALETGIYPYIILLPEGEDPDSLISKRGSAAFQEAVEQKKDLFIYLIEAERAKATDDNRRFHRLEGIKKLLIRMKDPYRRDYYAKHTAEAFGVSYDTLFSEVNISRAKVIVKKSNKAQLTNICEREFLSLLIELPEESADRLAEGLDEDYFEESTAGKLFKKMVELSMQSDRITALINDPDFGELVSELSIERVDMGDPYLAALDRKTIIIMNYFKKQNPRFEAMTETEQKTHMILERARKIHEKQKKQYAGDRYDR